MGMCVELHWPDKPESPEARGVPRESAEAREWWDAYWALSRAEIADTHGYMRATYGCGYSTWPGSYLDVLIAEVLDSENLVRDEDGDVIAGNLFEASIPASILRAKAQAHYDGDEVVGAWVALAERLEAEGVKPTIVACT